MSEGREYFQYVCRQTDGVVVRTCGSPWKNSEVISYQCDIQSGVNKDYSIKVGSSEKNKNNKSDYIKFHLVVLY